MRGLSRILTHLRNTFNKNNNTGARIIIFYYHMAFKIILKSYFGVETLGFLPICVTLKASFHNVSRKSVNNLGENCIQNFHLGRYIVGYTVGNLVLRRRVSGAVKRDFRTCI